MSELGDYKRLVEKPMIEKYEARIKQLEAALRAILIETDCRVAADLARAALAPEQEK